MTKRKRTDNDLQL